VDEAPDIYYTIGSSNFASTFVFSDNVGGECWALWDYDLYYLDGSMLQITTSSSKDPSITFESVLRKMSVFSNTLEEKTIPL